MSSPPKLRSDYKSYLNNPKNNFCTSFKALEGGNYKIVLVENYPCNSKEELLKRERYFIENNECVNRNVPTRTNKEYWVDYRVLNAEKLKQYLKNYNEKNKEKISENKRNYILLNFDKRKEYLKNYNEKNKEKIKEYKK